MTKEDLYKKAEESLSQAFEAAKHSVKVVSEKAGEAAHITKLLIEKATLEHKVTKQFTKLGSKIYGMAEAKSSANPLENVEVKAIIEEAKKFDKELNAVEATLEKEKSRSKKPAAKK